MGKKYENSFAEAAPEGQLFDTELDVVVAGGRVRDRISTFPRLDGAVFVRGTHGEGMRARGHLGEIGPPLSPGVDRDLLGEVGPCPFAVVELDLDALDIYEHCDSLDYVPSGISKKTAVTALAEKLGLPLSRVIAVGDGVNDYPMFECAGVSVGVDLASPGRADRNFKALSEALSFILGLTGGEG